jgi:hypothetical protein
MRAVRSQGGVSWTWSRHVVSLEALRFRVAGKIQRRESMNDRNHDRFIHLGTTDSAFCRQIKHSFEYFVGLTAFQQAFHRDLVMIRLVNLAAVRPLSTQKTQ